MCKRGKPQHCLLYDVVRFVVKKTGGQQDRNAGGFDHTRGYKHPLKSAQVIVQNSDAFFAALACVIA